MANTYLTAIEKAKTLVPTGTTFSYNEKDLILYALSLNAHASSDLDLIYELSPSFHALPTFGVVSFFNTHLPWHLSSLLPNFSSTRVVHGEHVLETYKHPIPKSATLVTHPKLVEVLDKGSGALVRTEYLTRDKRTGEEMFRNEFSLFVRGCGGFGGQKVSEDERKGESYGIPKREPDAAVEEATTVDQAALYRLNGDWNPLHIDPEFSSQGGYKIPILHGLGFFGISGKHIFRTYGAFKSVQVRFVGIVIPGQRLRTEMWKKGRHVIFQTVVVETGKVCLSQAGVELLGSDRKSKL